MRSVINISVIALTFIIAHKYMHQYVAVNVCNFAIFGLMGLIFMKFYLTVELRNLECFSLFWEVFALFLIGKGPIFGPKLSLGKSLVYIVSLLRFKGLVRFS